MRYLLVEAFDAAAGELQQCFVTGLRLSGGVGEIGQQAEVHVRVAVGEEADLESLDQGIHRQRVVEHRRHDDQGPRLRLEHRS